MAKILVVEDDIEVRESLEDALTEQNHVVDCVETGDSGREYLKSYEYDLIILDWNLPGMDGPQILRLYRSEGGTSPVLMLTGNREIEDKEQGFDAGADDYLTKPFDVREFRVRVKALLRRTSVATTNELKVGNLRLDPDNVEVSLGDKEIKLYPREFKLLEFLMRHPNQVFSSEHLMDRVWTADEEISPESVRASIKRLRKAIKLEDGESMIENIYGIGYKLKSSDSN